MISLVSDNNSTEASTFEPIIVVALIGLIGSVLSPTIVKLAEKSIDIWIGKNEQRAREKKQQNNKERWWDKPE